MPLEDSDIDRIVARLKGDARLILPPDVPDPVRPAPPAPAPASVPWYLDKNFWANVATILTLLVGLWQGQKQLADAGGKAEAAAAQSAANSEQLKQSHAETDARLAAVHDDVRRTDSKVQKALATPRTFLPAPPKEDER